MNLKIYFSLISLALVLLVHVRDVHTHTNENEASLTTTKPSAIQSTFSILDRLTASARSSRGLTEASQNDNRSGHQEDNEEDEEEDEDDADEESEDDDLDNEVDIDNDDASKNNSTVLTLFGNKIKLENNRTVVVIPNRARDLGLITLKAFFLGPLIGLTLKSALIKGLMYSVGVYVLRLLFPSLLATLGLGTGLIGFGRSLEPSLVQLVLNHVFETHGRSLAPRKIAGQ